MQKRTPEQIIGKDRVLQLIFEGYEVVPIIEKCLQCGGKGTTTMMPDGHEIECTACEGSGER